LEEGGQGEPRHAVGAFCPKLNPSILDLLSGAMFERGNPFPSLDHHKYPWISLTNAAVYLSRRDPSGRSRAVYHHEWAPPFSILLEWIEADTISVYECSTSPFERIQKEELSGAPIKFPSYTLADRLEIGSLFQPGSSTYIECNHNLLRLSPARDRFYLKDKPEPHRQDLRVQSEQLIAVLTGRLLRSPEAA
jgi:hypothetical protein